MANTTVTASSGRERLSSKLPKQHALLATIERLNTH